VKLSSLAPACARLTQVMRLTAGTDSLAFWWSCMWIRLRRVELLVPLRSRSIATIARPDRPDAQQLARASDRLGSEVGTMIIAGDLRLIRGLTVDRAV